MNIQSGNELINPPEVKPLETQQLEPSGWSAIPIKRTETREQVDEPQEAEQNVFVQPDNTSAPTQETGGPDKPTA